MTTAIESLLHQDPSTTTSGERKTEVVSDYLSGQRWLQAFIKTMPVDDDCWIKNDLMVTVDEVGIFVYRNKNHEWKRLGGVGFLSMAGFPVMPFGNGRRKINLESGLIELVPESEWPKEKLRLRLR